MHKEDLNIFFENFPENLVKKNLILLKKIKCMFKIPNDPISFEKFFDKVCATMSAWLAWDIPYDYKLTEEFIDIAGKEIYSNENSKETIDIPQINSDDENKKSIREIQIESKIKNQKSKTKERINLTKEKLYIDHKINTMEYLQKENRMNDKTNLWNMEKQINQFTEIKMIKETNKLIKTQNDRNIQRDLRKLTKYEKSVKINIDKETKIKRNYRLTRLNKDSEKLRKTALTGIAKPVKIEHNKINNLNTDERTTKLCSKTRENPNKTYKEKFWHKSLLSNKTIKIINEKFDKFKLDKFCDNMPSENQSNFDWFNNRIDIKKITKNLISKTNYNWNKNQYYKNNLRDKTIQRKHARNIIVHNNKNSNNSFIDDG